MISILRSELYQYHALLNTHYHMFSCLEQVNLLWKLQIIQQYKKSEDLQLKILSLTKGLMAGLCSRLLYSWRVAHLWIWRRWSVIFVSCREEKTRFGNILYTYIILVKWCGGIIATMVFETAWIIHGNLRFCSRLHYFRYWILFRNFYKFLYLF